MAYLDRSGDWGTRLAPSLQELESLVRVNFTKLPEKIRLLSPNVSLHIADFPDDNLLEEMGLDSPFDLLSSFHGQTGGTRFSLVSTDADNQVWLYRRPILDYWAENEESLDEIIAHLLLTELGRTFGLSEDELEQAIKANKRT